ncbi:MAG: DUF4397 domain-containing protein [Saprospiraceae bacterium]|nr:DUF4397 domain-containing protein [Saprospiraceae bacterium]
MQKTITTLLFVALTLFGLSAQTARVQIIHNSPTPTVDIYAGPDKLLDNFAFRTATPFIDVPAGVTIPIGVALGNSASAADALATFPVQFDAGKTYVVVATGIVGGNPGFELKAFDLGLENTVEPDNVGILFFHGSPNAPTVDVLTGGAPIINDASYGDFQGYLEVPAASYDLDITPGNDNSVVVASYRADLSFWKGRTAVIFASGFLGDIQPAFEPWVALSTGGTFPLQTLTSPPPPTPTGARLQVIHNSPTPTVDVYANNDLLLDNFVYRTATPFIDVPAGVQINIGIALANSTSASDALAVFPVTLEQGKTYVAIATGIVGGNPGFDIKIFDAAIETTVEPDNVGILFFHGSPDAPTVDVLTGGTPIINDASYGDFQGYLEVPSASYDLDITPGNDNSVVVASYRADLSFWKGRTAVIFASGFLGGGSPSFEPWVALSTGGTFPLQTLTAPPPPAPTGARLQVIHNSPTPTVDVYANNDLLLDNFVYRTATPFIDVPAGVQINIGIALANSTSASDALAVFPVTLEQGKTYVAIATGIVGGNPGFDIKIFDAGKEQTANPNDVGILFFHGSPDAPTVDVLTGGAPIINDASYGDFQGYLEVPAAKYVLSVTPGNDNNTVVAKYDADLSFWKGRTAVIFASGFLGGGSPSFEPWVALSNGGTFPLPVNNDFTPGDDGIAARGTSQISQISAFPNPVADRFTVNLMMNNESDLQAIVVDRLGRVVTERNFGLLPKGFNTLEFNFGNLPTGSYFLNLRSQEGVRTLKFMVGQP